MLTDTTRPRVSRETRRLLAAAGLALLALWILARVRFPERPPSANPVSPVLTQISGPTTFADLAEEVEEVRRRIAPGLAEVLWHAPGDAGDARAFPAWPWRDGLAVVMLPSASPSGGDPGIVAIDRPTGLALVRISPPAPAARTIWSPAGLEVPRYLFSAAPATVRPAVVPAYVSSLEPHRSQAWPTEIWKVPMASGLTSGALVFTAGGEWLGIAADENGQTVIVPAAAVLDLAIRLSEQQNPPGEGLGIEVQHLSAPLASAVGAVTGVIVSWVDMSGAAAATIAAGDVIEEVNGEAVPSVFAWQVHTTRLAAGASATLKVRRGGETNDVTLTVPQPAANRPGILGLTLSREGNLGSRVTQVTAKTAADHAGLKIGDIITMAGQQATPTPAQVRRAFDAVPDGGTVLLAITRGTTHRLVALAR